MTRIALVRLRDRAVKRIAVALLLPWALGAGGCGTAKEAGSSAGHCYDLKGRLVASITTEAECEYQTWQWRKAP